MDMELTIHLLYAPSKAKSLSVQQGVYPLPSSCQSQLSPLSLPQYMTSCFCCDFYEKVTLTAKVNTVL